MIEKISHWLFPNVKEDRLSDFEKVYLENRVYIRSVVYWMVRNDHVDDLVQEVFIKAWKSFDSFRSEAKVQTWLYRIARNTVIDYYRKSDREIIPPIKEVSETPDDILKETISLALKTLTVNHREAFVLFYKFGHTL